MGESVEVFLARPWSERQAMLKLVLPKSLEVKGETFTRWENDGLVCVRGPAIEHHDGSEPVILVRWIHRGNDGRVDKYLSVVCSEEVTPSMLSAEVAVMVSNAEKQEEPIQL